MATAQQSPYADWSPDGGSRVSRLGFAAARQHHTSLALLTAALACLGAGLGAGCSADPTTQILGPHQLHPDLAIELVAREPLVLDPVDLEFDERGRAFVLEMPGYPIVADDEEPPGHIVELIDEDGDGRFDRRRIFAEGFRYADSILPYRGGLLVADPPNLLFVKDSDGDGVADRRQILLKGFGGGASESNVNGLRRGLDNWIYSATGANGGDVYLESDPEQITPLRGQDFRFRFEADSEDPHRLADGVLETAGQTANGFGLDFDDWGRRFVGHAQRHIQAVVLPQRYLRRGHHWPGTTVEISDHGRGGSTRIFPISVTEDRVNHPEQAGHFTAGCGLTYYGGDALPESFRGSFFVAEAVHNLVHRDVVSASGAGFLASRSEQRSEILAVADNAFRPVNFTVGPDGALYLLDLQRAVIEHPEWIPDELEREMDVREGADRGRIYRLRARARPLPTPTAFPSEAAEWVERLGHPNRWWRDTAQRVLVEGAHLEMVDRLRELAKATATSPLARLHALWTLQGLGQLEAADLGEAFASESPGLRENALVLAEPFLGNDSGLAEAALGLAGASEPRVRMQALLSLSVATELEPRLQAELGREVRRALRQGADDPGTRTDDPWIQLAALQAASGDPLAILTPSNDSGTLPEGPLTGDSVRGLARLIGERGIENEMVEVLSRPLALPERRIDVLVPTLYGLADGLEGASIQGSLAIEKDLSPLLGQLLEAADEDLAIASWRLAGALGLPPTAAQQRRAREAAQRTLDGELSLEERTLQLSLLSLVEVPERLSTLLELLSVEHPEPLQQAALAELRSTEDADLANELVRRWRTLGPAVRQGVGDLLLYRSAHQPVLLDALESGEIPIGELNLHLERRRAMLRSPDATTRARAERLFSDLGVVTRAEALAAMKPALELAGDPARGRRHFDELCARCHLIGDRGTSVGPDLADLFRKSSLALLHDIVDPNAAISPEYVAFDLELKGGELLSGLVTSDGPALIVRTADGGEHRIDRSAVRNMVSSGLSLMPEELEAGVGTRGMADLLAFLQQRR